ncbi:hypothetical protein DPMN_122175 [Dreissena polymorpha]|uniref:Uncharacterized protein n=1 Tax=Dreissena polymorpha TaxID=45954 RepID=A0A9D4JRR5_DREPO|nr:hypothetical protein DPMN_122175 [Dreissena polymorpha]
MTNNDKLDFTNKQMHIFASKSACYHNEKLPALCHNYKFRNLLSNMEVGVLCKLLQFQLDHNTVALKTSTTPPTDDWNIFQVVNQHSALRLPELEKASRKACPEKQLYRMPYQTTETTHNCN